MQLSYVIQRLKNWSTLNVSHDFFDDIDLVYHINVCLVDIFSQMNAMGNWYFSNMTDTLVSPDVDWQTTKKKIRETTYDISRFWQVKWDWGEIDQANISLDITHPEEDETSPGYVMTWSKNIKTLSEFNTLEVVYARFPKRHDHADLSQEIDLPPQLLWALEFLVFWRLLPVFYEQWSSLANNYLNQAKETIQNYASNIGLASKQTRFTA